MNNPLQKYFRQPKLFISLPSKGIYYNEGALAGDYSNMPVFGMSGMDEMIMKTPDALFNGEATIKLIESCCPFIKDAGSVPSIDVDTILVAIRIATYGNDMPVSSTCPACKVENDYDIQLNQILDHFVDRPFSNSVVVNELTVNIKPLSYKEISEINVENFKLEKMLFQLNKEGIEDEVRQQHIDNIYGQLAKIQSRVMLDSIESITTPDETVSDKEFITEWLTNSLGSSYKLIKEKLESNKVEWSAPAQDVHCADCGHEHKISFTLDQSSFFV